MTHISDQIRK